MIEKYNIIFRRGQLAYVRAKQQRQRDIEVLHPYTGQAIDEPWYYYDRMYRGWQYDFANKMAAWASMPVINKVFSGVEAYTTMLCDQKPTIIVTPREPTDEERVEVAKAALQFWWDSSGMDATVSLAVKTSRIYGIGWLHTYYDKDSKEVKCVNVHPTHILVDPDCTVEDFNPSYLIYEYKASYGALKDMYDGKELEDGYVVDFKDFSPSKNWHIEVPLGQMEGRRYDDNLNPATSVNVYQFWIRDDEKTIWEDDDKALGPDKKVVKSKKKYPGGRVITIAGGLVIDDKPNPYKHGQFPFTPVHCYPVPGRFYGIGDVQMTMNIQAMRNRLVQIINDQTMKAGGGYIFVGSTSGVDPKKIGNLPLNIVPCRDPNAIRIERPPAPPRHVFDFIAVLDKDFDDTMGIHDISRGSTMTSHRTAEEISVMAESDRTRVRQAARYLVWALKRCTQQVVWDLVQFHKDTWFLRIAGNPDEIVPDGTEDGQMRNFREREFTGRDFLNYDGDELRYDFALEDASMLPTTQNEKTANVERWVAMGVITPDEVLKYKLLDIPEADKILADRMNNPQPVPQDAAAMGGADPMAMMGGGMPPVDPSMMMGGGMMPQMPMMPPQMPPVDPSMMMQQPPVDPMAMIGGAPPMAPEAMPMPAGGPDMGLVQGLAGPPMGGELPEELLVIAQRLADQYGVPVEQIIQMLMSTPPAGGETGAI